MDKKNEPRKHKSVEDVYSHSSNKYNNSYSAKRKENKKAKKRKRIINIVVVVLALILATSGGVMIYAHSALSSMFNRSLGEVEINMDALNPSGEGDTSDNPLPTTDTTSNLTKDPMVLNIALFGSDIRPDETELGNSDTIMLLSIDVRHQKLKLTSFMRDTWVRIPKIDCDGKLNAAYSAGGPTLAVETLERNFGVDIDRYAVVDFETFPAIIDALDGVDVTINDEEAEYLDHDFPYRTPAFDGAGTYHLNGVEALDHARNRHVGMYDFERTQRQRDVLMALVDKFKSTTDLASIIKVMVEFLPAVTTNISVDEMFALAKNSLTYLNYPVSQFRIPTADNYRDETNSKWGMILVIEDMDKAREDLARFIYEETVDPIYGETSSQVPEISSSSSVSSKSYY